MLLLFLLASSHCSCQSLLMFKKNKNRIAYYKKGDVISFRIKGDKKKITEPIRGFEDSLLVFKYFNLNPKEITHMYVDDKTKVWYFLKYKYEKLFLFAGTGYLILDVLNTGELSEETLIISGSLITAGLLAKWLISKRIKVKGKRGLYILNLD
jgi:hypothetical protein